MEFSLVADTVTVAAAQGIGFAKSLIRNPHSVFNNQISLPDFSSDQSSSSSAGAGVFQVSAVVLPVDAVAPPPVRPRSNQTAHRILLRKKRRTRRRRSLSGGSEDGEDEGFFGNDGGDGAFGGGGGGRGWNFGGFGEQNWDESSSSSSSDPAFDFVYEVLSWIALSNCVHYAFKKVVRIVAEGIGDAEREKVPMRLTPIC